MSTKPLIIVTLIAATIFALTYLTDGISSPEHAEFENFKITHHRHYSSPMEQAYRHSIFINNLDTINSHNAQFNSTYSMKVNQFADLTTLEFKQIYLTLQQSLPPRDIVVEEVDPQEGSVDWSQLGRVSRVKNQLMCGSCWAFATVGAVQSLYALKGIKVELSEQQLVDCSSTWGNNGCHGGELNYALEFISKRGAVLERDYPYTGKLQTCKKAKGEYKIRGYALALTCAGLSAALLEQPVAVAVDALNWGFYSSGVFSDCRNEVNHGVLVIGMTRDYWRIKNSWAETWGEGGYMRLARGNTCSICEYATYPLA